MKKIKFLLPFLVLFMLSGTVFGQSITIFDPPVDLSANLYQLPVTVEWYRTDGIVLTQTVYTTEAGISAGITVTAPPYWGIYSPIMTIKIYVYFNDETHYAIYPGTATRASRLKEPQYWIVVR